MHLPCCQGSEVPVSDTDWGSAGGNGPGHEGLWIQATQRLNPGIGTDDTLTRDRRIELPVEGHTSRAILDELMDRVKK
jgi:hypothetical protein